MAWGDTEIVSAVQGEAIGKSYRPLAVYTACALCMDEIYLRRCPERLDGFAVAEFTCSRGKHCAGSCLCERRIDTLKNG